MKTIVRRRKRAEPGRRRPGGRSQRVWEAVATAAEAVLVQNGYTGFGIPEVARLAGVNPTSLYRRWGSREALLTALLSSRADSAITPPDTGSLRADLSEYLGQAAAFLQTPYGSALLQLGATAMQKPELQPQRQAYWAERVRHVATILERAVQRGEVSGAIDPARAVEQLVGPLYARLLFTGQPIDAALIAASVANAIQPGLPAPNEALPKKRSARATTRSGSRRGARR